ncbi:hypothetical protein HYH03_007276 [Edaphochlamys debaryana]|uniref:PAS domain-containing protein n=1 Tax=Edaphochlamys debaryana TaxID=47281 RepID=A0A835Y227_9CHLO|nr:hypothetical protein HYH03_007276 [Edaphochlamys debaryana]|eukprot:KAG2494508.1 hypothetical protein HYH03_007276 [Edaphochlamys debaryana]
MSLDGQLGDNGIFGVLFTLSKEAGEQRVVIRWVLLKILLDGWQLFTTVIIPDMGWDIDSNGTAWDIVGVLNFQWLSGLGYSVYLVVLYGMVSLLAINVGLCVWVAWCFKEQKFPVVWPIKVLRVFSSLFFQAFDVACLNLLQASGRAQGLEGLGISCRYTGFVTPHMRLDLFPQHSCTSAPHLMHAIVSALSLILFVAIALLLNMAEVEVNPLSLRPMALGHSGAEVAAFGIKVLLTLTDVFLGWRRVCACANLALSLGLAWVYLRRSPHLVAWPNHMKSGVSLAIVWCCACSVLLVFEPGVSTVQEWDDWRAVMTVVMLAGLGPAFLVGAALSKANPEVPLRQTYKSIDDPRDVEVVARCCRVWHEDYKLDPEAVNTAHQIIKAGLAMFPGSAFMVLLHANFMIDVLGVHQSGSRRIEDARKLSPSLMCRFIMFVRQQQATQKDAGNSANDGNSMDLLGYVEYQRKQRMVVRLHRDALQAMCNFWRALDSSTVSFIKLSKALGNIERSVSQAQTAYRVVLESYGSSPKLVRLYGKFLETIKNDPWGAAEYFTEADRLEETKNTSGKGPLLPDGTPLGRMDEMSMAVLVINSSGEVQMANKQTHTLFGYKKGALEGKPLAILVAPHFSRRLATQLEALVMATGFMVVPGSADSPVTPASQAPVDGMVPQTADAGGRARRASLDMRGAGGRRASIDNAGAGAVSAVDPNVGADLVIVGMHLDRVAFLVKLSIRKASGVGEDTTFLVIMEPLPPQRGQASLWVAPNGTVAACDPQFVSNFGWRATEVQGAAITALMTLPLPELSTVDELNTATSALDLEEAWGAGLPLEPEQEAPSDVLRRLLAQARAETATGFLRTSSSHAGGKLKSGRHGVEAIMNHKYDSSPCPVTVTVFAGASHTQHDLPIHELRIRLVNPNPPQLLVANRKGVILHTSPELAASLKDTAGSGRRRAGLGGDAESGGGTIAPLGHKLDALGVASTEVGSSAFDQLAGFTLQDFLPPPWKDTHAKLLKEITALSPPGRTPFSCRKGLMPGGGAVGPTLELRTVSGKPLYMAVAVTTSDMGGEPTHVVRMAKSSLDVALAERRVRLSVSADGRITNISKGPAAGVLGLKKSEVLERGLWEIIKEETSGSDLGYKQPLTTGPRMLTAMVERSLAVPGRSWRVSVSAPVVSASDDNDLSGAGRAMFAAARAAKSKAAIMQVRLPTPDEVEADAQVATAGPRAGAAVKPKRPVFAVVELWPTTSVMGLLQLDAEGRVAAVLEEHMRPAGLLFGLPSGNLLGEPLSALVTLPPGCADPSDLLSNRAAKKSSLKTNRKDQPVKVGPVHVLQALHADGRPVNLDVQVVGKPEGGQPVTAILRLHAAPMMPGGGFGPSRPGSAHTTAGYGQSRPGTALAAAGPRMLSHASSATILRRLENAVLERAAGLKSGDSGDDDRRFQLPRPADSAEEVVPTPLKTPHPAASAEPAGSSPAPTAKPATPSGGAACPEGAGEAEKQRPPLAPGAPAAAPDSPAVLAGMGKLADLVTSIDSGLLNGSVTGRKRPERVRLAAGKQAESSGAKDVGAPDEGPKGAPADAEGSAAAPAKLRVRLPGSVHGSEGKGDGRGDADSDLDAVLDELGRQGSKIKGAPSTRARSVYTMAPSAIVSRHSESEESDEGEGSAKAEGKAIKGDEHVKKWVESEGLFYVNTVPIGGSVDTPAPTGRSNDGSDDGFGAGLPNVTANVLTLSPPSEGRKRPTSGRLPADKEVGALPEAEATTAPAGPAEEDAASEGGQSAGSGLSASSGGAEYKRGKRFRKLARLMDSPQAQKAQHRLRRHALIVVALLAAVHVVCFVLALLAFQKQREAMLAIGYSGQSQRFMHRIMTDTRSLDIITTNRTLPNLFTPDQADFFVERIARDAEQVKVRINAILDSHHDSGSNVVTLFYNTTRSIWSGNNPDGSDIYANVSVWDFCTRFYSMARIIQQNGAKWVAEGVVISRTQPGQFLLKSGPDLFRASRQILDALLYDAVAAAETVDELQLILLGVEGAAMSCLAALYLAYLLKAVAAQRYKLYGTFLLIPVGLTRALASQNTNLLVGEDDDEDGDDDDPPATVPPEEDQTQEEDSAAPKQKRRATVQVEEREGAGGKGTERRGSRGNLDVTTRASSATGAFGNTSMRRRGSHMSLDSANEAGGGGMFGRVKRFFARRRRGVHPLSHSGSVVGAAAAAAVITKRKLKYDSYETWIMLLPFILWSALVIGIYVAAVLKMLDIVQVVAIHSVSNFIAARTYRTVFFAQEWAASTTAEEFLAHRNYLATVLKLVRDAWYTLQLGENAYMAAGPNVEHFPLVQRGLAYDSVTLRNIFYESGDCHRMEEHLPCPGPSYRFYTIASSGLDTIMEQFMLAISQISLNTTTFENDFRGLADSNFDFIYNVGSVDLLDGCVEISEAHFRTLNALFDRILVLHIILFLMLWVIFAGFVFLLLQPLLRRVTKERRRIAELMSQLPLELDVEKLVSRALLNAPALGNAPGNGTAPGSGGGGARGGATAGGLGAAGRTVSDDPGTEGSSHELDATVKDATNKWKAIIRQATVAGKSSITEQRKPLFGR